MVSYATVDDLAPKYVATAPADAELLLERATTLIDGSIMCAVYEVDDDGLPTDTALVDALKRATCEQVAAWLDAGETGTGGSATYGDVQIASVRLGRGSQSGGAGGGGSAADCLAPQPEKILRLAGLLGQEPRTYPLCEASDG